MQDMIGLDFETYAATSLPQYGLYNYVRCETFRVLIAGITVPHLNGSHSSFDIDFTDKPFKQAKEDLRNSIAASTIVAHNVPFEQAVLSAIGLDYPDYRFIDSAVVARAAGASGHLAGAAPQLLNNDKLDGDGGLMKLFSIPKEGQVYFDKQVIADNPEAWKRYREYCRVDSLLGLCIVEEWGHVLTKHEHDFERVTLKMNRTGWRVDIDTVEEMHRRYLENQAQALEDFRKENDAPLLNLNSLPQLKEWCADRGVKATSFDEAHVAKYLAAIEKKLTGSVEARQHFDYLQVQSLLETKQILGGASLKKLQVILDTATYDGEQWRLKDQYLHCGAGQTLRTTGRSVQMQNLKRLDAEHLGDMEELEDPAVEWDNTKLALNIRQVFTSSHPDGRLIVGDFASVESRGLAYLAGAKWKLDGFRLGMDMYKVQAAKIYGTTYEAVTKAERQTGKVGELSCGYGAGGGAVKDFAAKMGVEMVEAEANKLVFDWRQANPEVVEFWSNLDEMLHDVVEGRGARTATLSGDLTLTIVRIGTPLSLLEMHSTAHTIQMTLTTRGGIEVMKRFFHGCYIRGRDVCYYKPSDRKTGDLWKSHFIHPKTKQLTFYKLYGGKLAGILTQSFCRELFMEALVKMDAWCNDAPNVSLVGQFHDEIVLDWWPDPAGYALVEAKDRLETFMSDSGWARNFPLVADVKDDYRYTK